MDRKTLLDLIFNQKPQLATPTISLSGDILSIEEVENAEYYDIYVDGVLEESVPAVDPVSYSVSFTIEQQMPSAKEYLRIYDGQDDTGTLLYESTSTASETLTPTVVCTTGYLYLVAEGSIIDVHVATVSNGITVINETSNSTVYKVEADGTISGYVDYQD